ncbi:BsuPI-related putative proteinase inhibitor [Bacillus fonticola]|uniref:BsuPI-related putative proteinase inhibitor n=1 Tax=Bacillus fonticola TaxID=2728853 RepID=UPI0014756D41|nr:BsuPI-related putative proteinase inhibitor [Bacillus fonticola]
MADDRNLSKETDGALLSSLTSELEVKPHKDCTPWTYQVLNNTKQHYSLIFRSGQQYDYVLMKDDKLIEKYSDGKMFTQQIIFRNIAPGDSLSWSGEWCNLSPGKYALTFWVTDLNWSSLTKHTFFEIH